jgi:hypothetical protein
MKTIVLTSVLLLGTTTSSFAQDSHHDAKALTVLNRMADNIGALHSCSFRLEASHDAMDADAGMVVKLHNSYEVFLVGPDRMTVSSTGDGGRKGFWYDGKDAYMYWYGENNYGHVAAPATIIEMIDRIHQDYGVDFPAADLLYPTFVDDLRAQSRRITFAKSVRIGGQECFHVVAQGTDQDMELWIANDAMTLPVKYLFRTRANGQTTEYEGTFTEWKLNPELPMPMFSFTPPPGAREVRLVARNGTPPQPQKTGGKKK